MNSLDQIAELLCLVLGHFVLVGLASVVGVVYANRAMRVVTAMRATGAQRDRLMTAVMIAVAVPLGVALLSCAGVMALEHRADELAGYWSIGLAVASVCSVAVGAALGHVRIASVEREGPNDAADV